MTNGDAKNLYVASVSSAQWPYEHVGASAAVNTRPSSSAAAAGAFSTYSCSGVTLWRSGHCVKCDRSASVRARVSASTVWNSLASGARSSDRPLRTIERYFLTASLTVTERYHASLVTLKLFRSMLHSTHCIHQLLPRWNLCWIEYWYRSVVVSQSIVLYSVALILSTRTQFAVW